MVSLLNKKTAADRVSDLEAERDKLGAALDGLSVDREAAHAALTAAYVAAERGTGSEAEASKAEDALGKIDHIITRKRAALEVVTNELEHARLDADEEARQAKRDRIAELRKETGAIADTLEKKGLDSDPEAWKTLDDMWKEAQQLSYKLDPALIPGISKPPWRAPKQALALRLNTISLNAVGLRLPTLAGLPPQVGDPPNLYPTLRAALGL